MFVLSLSFLEPDFGFFLIVEVGRLELDKEWLTKNKDRLKKKKCSSVSDKKWTSILGGVVESAWAKKWKKCLDFNLDLRKLYLILKSKAKQKFAKIQKRHTRPSKSYFDISKILNLISKLVIDLCKKWPWSQTPITKII